MKKALIVDDDPTTCMLIERYMRKLDYESVFALSGVEALDKIHSSEFDVVISDVRMPNGSGIDLLREIQKQEHRIPVILISAELEGAKSQAKAMGAAFLLKPITRECLEGALAQTEAQKEPVH